MSPMEDLFPRRFEESIEVKRSTMHTLLPDMAATRLLEDAYRSSRKSIFLGNGGSAADAQHMAAELVGRYLRERPALPSLALTTNSTSVTAIAHDYGYEQVFVLQLEAFLAARHLGLKTIAVTGRTGGRLATLCDVLLNVPSDDTPRIQECHTLMGHTLCEAVEAAMALNG